MTRCWSAGRAGRDQTTLPVLCPGSAWLLVVLIAALRRSVLCRAGHRCCALYQALRADAVRLPRARTAGASVLIITRVRRGNGVAVQLVVECRKRGIEPILRTPRRRDLSELAEDAVRRGADLLAWRGGDWIAARVASGRGPGPTWDLRGAFPWPAPATHFASPSIWDWTGRPWWERSRLTRTRGNGTSIWPG